MWVELTAKVLLLLLVLKNVEVESNFVSTIQCPQKTNWGDWDAPSRCPDGSFVICYRLCNEPYRGIWKDDKAMTGIQMRCNDPSQTVLSSKGAHVGTWSEWVCLPPRQGFKAVNMKVDCTFTLDHVSTTNMKMQRSDGTWVEAMKGHEWGKWVAPVDCPAGTCICGMRTQYEASSLWCPDSTAINHMNFDCCTC